MRKGREIVKPDITMVKDGHCTIIEMTCPYEASMDYLQQREEENVSKCIALIQGELHQVECHTGEVISLVIGRMGTILEKTNGNLKRVRLTKQRGTFQMTTIMPKY